MAADVKGSQRLERTLLDASGELGDMQSAADKSAELVAAGARARAPRNTGTLAQSITTTREAAGAVVRVGAPYGMPVHQGVPAKGIEARPFLANAVDAAEVQIAATYGEETAKTIHKVKGA